MTDDLKPTSETNQDPALVKESPWYLNPFIAVMTVLQIVVVVFYMCYNLAHGSAGNFSHWRVGDGIPGHYEYVRTLPNEKREVVDSTGWATPFDLELPDGSKVRLAYGSKLRYIEGFAGGTREVSLTGQAEFTVVNVKDIPFFVYAGYDEVLAVDGHFNVLAIKNEPVSEVTALKGMVHVINGRQNFELTESHQLMITGDSVVIFKRLDFPNGAIGWAASNAFFQFENVDLIRVIRRMAGWYRKKVSSPANVSTVSVTGKFDMKDPLDSNLAKLRNLAKSVTQIQLKGDTIFLMPSK
jgi:ferric-dicitrate binding protein FerR (iron transport regulator)